MLDKKDRLHSMLKLEAQQKHQQIQRLMMSAHMQQAIQMLQIPLMELENYIEQQVVLNPLLEIESDSSNEKDNTQSENDPPSNQEDAFTEKELTIDEHDFSVLKQLEEDFQDLFVDSPQLKRSKEEEKLRAFIEQSICADVHLYDQLGLQARESFQDPQDLKAADILIGYIDESGFLKTPLSEIALLHEIQEATLQKILKEIQTFEPYGVGAANIQESLLIQLRCLNKHNTLAYLIVERHYDELLRNHIPSIQKKLGRSLEDIREAIEKDIAKLDLHPGASFSSLQAQPIVPDVTLRQEGEQLIVEVNRDYVPSLRLNHRYLRLLDDPNTPKETKHFIRHHLLSAKWLSRNLQQRYLTIERIAQSLSQKQYQFFTNPNGKLLPLTMKELADELDVHESTIARTVSNKYINSPRGLMPLRAFFTTGYVSQSGEDLSATTVQDKILEIIKAEDKQHPYSDEEISQKLKQEGIPCARRTIAKYRSAMKIGNTLQRKKF